MSLPSALEGRLSLPVVAAPMFLVSGVELVLAACNEGILGTFPALNARTTEALDGWVAELSRLNAPYGVNLVVHRTNPRVQADLEVLERHRVPVVITSLGAAAEVVERVHKWGGVVFHDVTNAHHAKKAADAGVDGIIAVAAGAGGHAGTLHPFALVTEIRGFFQKTLLLGGCINTGAEVLAALTVGADLAYMGTRFIATQESSAGDAYRQMVVDARAADIVYTPAVSGVPANFMRPSLEKAGYDMEKLLRPGEVDYGNKLKPADDEAKAWKTVWSAGHGVAGVRDVPTVKELVDRLRSELAEARARVAALR
ncbi:MAG: nitronate monooxygenase [Deltaproteobacteria bacterium]|nr:nitronate monooxygenase [Deltaproteobacteria bacterium]